MSDWYDGPDQDASLLGLGYLASSSSGEPSVDYLMQHYMHQCLEFHEEQQAKRNASNHEAQFVPAAIKQEDDEDVYCHDMKKSKIATSHESLSASASSLARIKEEMTEVVFVSIPPKEEQASRVSMEALKSEEDAAEEIRAARIRAEAIVARFQQQQQQLLQAPCADTPWAHDGVSSPVFVAQRQAALREEQSRKEHFLQKNLHYVAGREQKRLEELSQTVDQAQQWSQEYQALLEERQRTRYEQRKQAAANARNTSQAGIGTAQRRRPKERMSTVAVYLSGLPTDGIVDSEFIRTLFESYGHIQKVHLYRDKSSDALKGDGLVIFRVSSNEEQENLLRNVCEQVSTWLEREKERD